MSLLYLLSIFFPLCCGYALLSRQHTALPSCRASCPLPGGLGCSWRCGASVCCGASQNSQCIQQNCFDFLCWKMMNCKGKTNKQKNLSPSYSSSPAYGSFVRRSKNSQSKYVLRFSRGSSRSVSISVKTCCK